MARRHRKKHSNLNTVNRRVARKHLPFSNPRIATTQNILKFDYSPWLDDRRRTVPRSIRRYAPQYTIDRAPVVLKQGYVNDRPKLFAPFPDQKLRVCVRRKTRREVIFATGKGGKSVRRRKPTRNFTSTISCK